MAAGLSPAALLAEGAIERVDGLWRPPGCEDVCTPSLEFEERRAEGLVGVACPLDPACWHGWEWHPATVVESFTCSLAPVLAAIRQENDLEPLRTSAPQPGTLSLGVARMGELRIPVVLVQRAGPSFEITCLGLQQKLGGDGLVVLVSDDLARTLPRSLASNVAILGVPDPPTLDLRLSRARKVLDPDYRSRSRDDPRGVFDDVDLDFAFTGGERLVRIDGIALAGFRKSDLKFLRLLYLAGARRAESPEAGWVPKSRLRGDEKDHDLEQLRAELRKGDHPALSPDERVALVKTEPGQTGRVRLAVRPARIRFDPSLPELVISAPPLLRAETGRRTPGAEAYARSVEQGVVTARQLLADVARLGVPVSTPSAGQRRTRPSRGSERR